MNRHFFQKGNADGQQVMKRCSTSLIIREMQIKTTIRYHHTLVRMTAIRKNTDNKCWQGCGEKRTLTLLVGMETDAATV